MTKMTKKWNFYDQNDNWPNISSLVFIFFFKLIFFGLKFYFLFVNKSYGQTNSDKSMNLQNQTDKNET